MPEIIDTNKDRKFIMSVHVGQGKDEEGTEFEILQNTNGSPLIRFENGIYVSFDWNEIVNQAFELKNQYLEKGSDQNK